MLDLEKFLNKDLNQEELYKELVEIGKSRKPKKTDYVEKHHILPRCMGGTDDESNLVLFTALEHIVAHILLYRIYPDNNKIVMAADCMLKLANANTAERERCFSKIPLTILSELREKAVATKETPVCAYLYTKEDKSEIKIYRIFSGVNSAMRQLDIKSSSFFSSISKGEDKITVGYYWKKLKDLEIDYPEAVSLYYSLNDIELPDFNPSKPVRKISPIICYDDEFNIIRIYEKAKDIINDGFSPFSNYSGIYRHDGYYWTRLDKWDRKDKLDEFYSKTELPPVNPIKRNNNTNKKIVKINKSNNIEEVYSKSALIPGIDVRHFSKYLDKGRIHKNYYWYTQEKFIELFPERQKELEDFINDDSESGRQCDNRPPTEMKILLTIPEKLVSVNDLYKAKIAYKAGRPYPVLYKNPKSIQNGNVIMDQLRALDLKKYIPWLSKTKKYEILINFVLKTGVYRRDVSNLDKDVIDYITSFIKNDLGVEHFDDSEIFHCSFTKSICPGAKKEMICFILRESFMEERIDIIEKPSRLYLDGTISPSIPWRNEVTEMLKDNKIETFNPELEIYDAELRYDEKNTLCDSSLFLITPGDLSETLTQKILEEATFKTSDKFLYVGILGDLLEYNDEELSRIKLLETIIKNSGKNKTYYKELDELGDIKNWIK